MANTHYNKITIQFANRRDLKKFYNWIIFNYEELNAEELKVEWDDYSTRTLYVRFETKYEDGSKIAETLAEQWNAKFMLEHFCPETSCIDRYVFNGYDETEFHTEIDDLTFEQALIIDDLDDYGLSWDIISKRDGGEYCFHIERVGKGFPTFKFSIRHFEGEFNEFYGDSEKEILEHTQTITPLKWDAAYKVYMKLLEGEKIDDLTFEQNNFLVKRR